MFKPSKGVSLKFATLITRFEQIFPTEKKIQFPPIRFMQSLGKSHNRLHQNQPAKKLFKTCMRNV